MAKKVKFPLILKNEVQVRTIEELKDNFDLGKIYEYFCSGKLLTWLEDRYYEEEADQIRNLDRQASELKKKLCSVFGVECPDDSEIDLEQIESRRRKRELLKQFTDDEHILEQAAHVAFNQEDLADLLDEGKREIYLCNGHFNIPLSIKSCRYTGIGNPVVEIKSKNAVSLDELDIVLENVEIVCPENIKITAMNSNNVTGTNVKAEEEKHELSLERIPVYITPDFENICTYVSAAPISGSKKIVNAGAIALYSGCDEKKHLVSVLGGIEQKKYGYGLINSIDNSDYEEENPDNLLGYCRDWYAGNDNEIYFIKDGKRFYMNLPQGTITYDHCFISDQTERVDSEEFSGIFKAGYSGGKPEQVLSMNAVMSFLKSKHYRNEKEWYCINIDIFFVNDKSMILHVQTKQMRDQDNFLISLNLLDNEMKILDSSYQYDRGINVYTKVYSDADKLIYAVNENITQYNVREEYSLEIANGIKNINGIRYRDTKYKEPRILEKDGQIYYVKNGNIVKYDIEKQNETIIKEAPDYTDFYFEYKDNKIYLKTAHSYGVGAKRVVGTLVDDLALVRDSLVKDPDIDISINTESIGNLMGLGCTHYGKKTKRQ